MKNKLLLILIVLLFVGCGKEAKKNDPTNLSYMHSYMTEKIDNENTRIYAFLKNTSENTGNIKYVTYGVLDSEDKVLYHDTIDYDIKFTSGEQVLVIFEVPINIDKITYLSITPMYNSKDQVEKSIESSEYKQVDAFAQITKIDANKVTINVNYNKETKLDKVKLTIYNAKGYPVCLSYLDVNKTVKQGKKYNYSFECNNPVNKTDSIALEEKSQ